MNCLNCKTRKSRARGLCDRCYKAERKAAMEAGTWKPQQPPLVDGAAAAEHLDRLAQAGVSRWQVVRITGVGHPTVYGIAAGRNVAEATSRRILAVPLPATAHVLVGDRGFVPACGTTRRLQALCALGWPLQQLARRLGNVHPGHLGEVCRGERELVMAYTARAIEALYEKLSGTPGPSQRVRALAQHRRWAPPLCWAEDVSIALPNICRDVCPLIEHNRIDDPAATPAHMREVWRGGRRQQQPPQPVRERYEDLRALGYTSDAQIAARLGMKERSLGRELAPSRDGRQHA